MKYKTEGNTWYNGYDALNHMKATPGLICVSEGGVPFRYRASRFQYERADGRWSDADFILLNLRYYPQNGLAQKLKLEQALDQAGISPEQALKVLGEHHDTK